MSATGKWGMRKKIVSTAEHYDRLIAMDNDPFRDPPELKAYMNGWTGEVFWSAVGEMRGLDQLDWAIVEVSDSASNTCALRGIESGSSSIGCIQLKIESGVI